MSKKKAKRKRMSNSEIEIKITPFGLFAFQDGKLIKKEIWGKDPETCARKYLEREELVKNFSGSLKIKAKRKIKQSVGEEIEKLALQAGFTKKNFKEFYQKFMIELTKLKLKRGFSYDKLIKQSVRTLEELDRMINILYERLREWYGFYYPEALENVERIEDFLKLPLEKKGQSMGYDLREEDVEMIKKGMEELKALIKFREQTEKYLESLMKESAPNLLHVAGALLGGKLIAHAGSLRELAMLPSSTIQVLGAEKALFRHLRKGTKPPKHGMILMHPLLRKAKKSEKGKIARRLAAKIALAAKIDYYSGGKDERWKELLEDLKK